MQYGFYAWIYFLSEKGAKVLFEINIKSPKYNVDVYLAAPFYKLFRSGQPYLFKLFVT